MILVVDANIVVAALIKNGASRKALLSGKFKLLAPEFLKEEVHKHTSYIVAKSGLPEDGVDLLITLIFQEIELIPVGEYESALEKAAKLMKEDLKDAPYVACCLAMKCDGVWTDDSDYKGKRGVKVFGTEYLLRLL